MTKVRTLFLVVALAMLVPAFASTTSARQDAGTEMIDQLNLGDFGGGSNPQVNFNPYVPATRLAAFGLMYEPLIIVNGYSCTDVPWLATGYEWTDPQTLVFTMREGVTWSDGTPLTADDVAFTFNLLKQFPQLDERGFGPFLTGATAAHPTVTLTFNEPGAFIYTKIVETLIVPKHIWETVEDPVTFVNEEPVGSGPFLLKAFNGQQLTMERNASYWQADKVRVQELVYSKAAEGQVNQLQLAEGAFDTNAMFVPDIEQTYVARDPEHNNYWFPSGASISLYLNLTKAPFDDVEFRRGVAHAINRDDIALKAQFGYVTTASQTGLVLPNQQAFLDETIPNAGNIPFDTAQADQILAAAGYTKDGDGRLIGKDGQPIEFNFSVEAGYNDWIQASQIIQENLAAVGITANVQTITPPILDEDKKAGNFDMVFGVHGGTCNMFQNYYDFLSTDRTKPVGEQTPLGGNYVRWQDPETDALLAELRVAADVETQTPILHGLQQIMVNEFPTIPLWYGAQWFQYSTEKAEGWPNAENPYATPGQALLIYTTLTPAP